MKFSKKWLGNVLLIVGSPIVFFLVIEGFLWMLQVKPLEKEEDPFLSFSNDFLFEKEFKDGKILLKTRSGKEIFFNPQFFSLEKDKKNKRIFVLGGSTVYGRPYRDVTSFSNWLRNYLAEIDPSKKWEVINAGGISYASYRIVKLAEEFLNYNPDFFIIYMGHNEFLESRTYEKIRKLPSFIKWISEKMSQTRVFSLAFRWLNVQKLSKQRTTEKRKNIIDTDFVVIKKEVNTKLDHFIGPEQFYRDDDYQQEVVEHFQYSLNKLINMMGDRNIPVILINPASNVKDCSPFKSQWFFSNNQDSVSILKDWNFALLQEKKGKEKLAIKMYQNLVKKDVRYSEVHYRLGKLLLKQKKYTLAKEQFLKAKEEDVCPLRIINPLEEVILSFKNNTNVTVLDFKQLLEIKSMKKYQHSILGKEFFLDHVHLRIEQHQFLAQKLVNILDSLEGLKMEDRFLNKGLLDSNLQNQVEKNILSKIDTQEKGLALHQLAKVLNWSGKHEEAVEVAYEALALNKMNKEAYFSYIYIATSLDREGRVLEALPFYKSALKMNPTATEAMQFLAYAFFRQNRFDSAMVYYERLLPYTQNNIKIDLLYRLARLSILTKQWKKAKDYFLSVEGKFSKEIEWNYGVGLSLLHLKKLEDSKFYFEKILQNSPYHPWANLQIGIVLESLGEIQKSLFFYKRALYVNPNLQEAKIRLEQLKSNLK